MLRRKKLNVKQSDFIIYKQNTTYFNVDQKIKEYKLNPVYDK